jgi:16S rRNA (cytosine1402-N4)-methyltransferase
MHTSVLLEETIYFLNPKPNDNFIDATFGFGGHSFKILNFIKPNGKILALEWDPYLVEIIKKIKMPKNIILRNTNFKNIKKIVKEEKFSNVKGVIFDLGISNWHYKNSKRGFSFNKDEFLDMRINPFDIKITVFDVVNYFSRKELINIFESYGEEKEASRVADFILKKRKEKKIETTKELAEIVLEAKKYKKKNIHPATQVFMALRNFINQELENLEIGLEDAYEILIRGGRIAIITFNGLEDKVVKRVFKKLKARNAKLVTKNVIKPSLKEIKDNPAARSAKLRVIEKNE